VGLAFSGLMRLGHGVRLNNQKIEWRHKYDWFTQTTFYRGDRGRRD
jgi:hypothetical protein